MVSPREVRQFLEENPDLEDGLKQLLEAEEPFEFHDVDLDSGTFGELVSTEYVTDSSHNDGYQIVDRNNVRKGLKGDITESDRPNSFEFTDRIPEFEWDSVGLLALGLLFVGFMRTIFSFSNVYQNGDVVLSGNDPYYYRFLVEALLSNPETTLTSLPGSVANGEPLYVTTMWFASNLLGGSDQIVGHVLAWYPVLSAIGMVVLLYVLAMQVTDDRRIALAAVLFLAILPGHAMRTSLGFADHHAFDFFWLGLTAVSLVAIVRNQATSRRTILGSVGLGLGVAGQTLAWEAGPLLTGAVGLSVFVLALLWIHQRSSPLQNGIPLIGGLGLAAILTWLVHSIFGWHTTQVMISPGLLLAGAVGVLAIAELIYRLDESIVAGLAAEFIGAVIALFLVATQATEFWNGAITRINRQLFRSDAIAETQSLFGNSVAWLLLFGFILVIAIPYLLYFSYQLKDEIIWAVPVVYFWWLFGLSAIQIRFVGEFGFIAAFFAAIGFVHMLAWMDATRLPKPFDHTVDGQQISIPDRNSIIAIGFVFLLVGGLSILQVPVKTSQLTTPNEQYEAASWMADYNEEKGLEYPENYVFSQWGDSRMYNYFVNGESRSYGFAQNNYADFLGSSNPGEWHNRLSGRVGFIVVEDLGEGAPASSIYYQLLREDATNLGGFQKGYETEDGSKKVFIVTNRTDNQSN